MNPPNLPPIALSKPRWMPEADWRELLRAARCDWLAYVLPWRWCLPVVGTSALGAFVGSYWPGRDLAATWEHFLTSGFWTWGVGFLLAFRLLFASLDRAGKRKQARQLGIMPPRAKA